MRKLENFAKYTAALRPPIIPFEYYKAFFLSIFLITGILFTSLFFLRPKIFEILEIQKKINKERKMLADLTQKAATLEGLDEIELTEKTEVLLKALPPEKDVANILLTFKVLGSQAEITLQGIQVDSGDTFSLKIEGGTEKIIRFMERIETSYPLMKLEEIAVSSREGSSTQATAKVQAFFLPLPQALGSVESPLSLVTPQEEKIYQDLLRFTPVLTEEDMQTIQSGKENPFTF